MAKDLRFPAIACLEVLIRWIEHDAEDGGHGFGHMQGKYGHIANCEYLAKLQTELAPFGRAESPHLTRFVVLCKSCTMDPCALPLTGLSA